MNGHAKLLWKSESHTEEVILPLSTVPGGRLAEFPPVVKTALLQLDEVAQHDFIAEHTRQRKRLGVAYLLWFFLGWHYAYNGKWGVQFLYWFTAAGLGIWAFIDLFRLPGIVTNTNKDLSIAIMRDVVALNSARVSRNLSELPPA